jgi:hypothetical protein
MFRTARLTAQQAFVMPVETGIQVADSVRHIVEKRYPDEGIGDGPRFSPG